MNPPKLNLRQFMSYLAPGGYYLLQILFLFSFTLWLISNIPLSIDLIKKDVLNNTLVITGFIVLIVLSYFMGIILRLYSVDDIDRISANFELRKTIRQYTFKNCGLIRSIEKLCYNITMQFCTQAISIEYVNNHIEIKSEYNNIFGKLKKLIDSEPSNKSKDFDIWFNQQAAKKLKQLNGDDGDNLHSCTVQKTLINDDLSGMSDLLWLTDDFPYPLWHTYSACLRSDLTPSDINQHLWPVLKATLHGKMPADAPERPTKIPFNHCKLFVLEHSPTLASEIYEREALVRMMAGFYHGAKIGLNWSMIMIAILSTVWLGKHCISDYVRELELLELKIAYLTLLFSIGFNAFLKHRIIENFRHLRSSETHVVFDSYLIVKNRLSKSNINRR